MPVKKQPHKRLKNALIKIHNKLFNHDFEDFAKKGAAQETGVL